MTNYYFVSNTLPPIEVGVEPELSFVELSHLFLMNLSKGDLEKVATVRRYHDILNLRLLWQEADIDPRGNYSELELEEALLTKEGFGDYVFKFLEKYESSEARLRHFGELVESYFREECSRHSGFLLDYFQFEREWRLVMVGFRAKLLGRDLAVELQHEDPSDTIVAQLIAQKDAKSYEPPYGYEELKPLFERYADDPIELHKAVCHYRFKRIDEMIEGDLFSLDRILGYTVQLIICEQWQELDAQQGEQVVETIMKG